jgi:Fe-S-cluster-containing hydrogenase component 2
MKVVVNEKRCPQDHRCPAIKVCPVGAITQDEFNAPKINKEICIRCGKCISFCPKKAITFDN